MPNCFGPGRRRGRIKPQPGADGFWRLNRPGPGRRRGPLTPALRSAGRKGWRNPAGEWRRQRTSSSRFALARLTSAAARWRNSKNWAKSRLFERRRGYRA